MDDDFLRLCRELDAALRRYGAWERPLRRYRAEEYRRLNAHGFTWEAYQDGLAQLEAQLAAEDDPRAELHPLFERLCAAYVAAGDERRQEIRAWVAERKRLANLLWRYANHLRHRLANADDANLAKRALLALAIENSSANYRDTQMTLADLYVAAETAGIDPQPLFTTAAAWSTDELTAGGCTSLAAMMREFHASSVLRERRAMAEPYGGPT